MSPISVIIIAKNEASNIDRAVTSVHSIAAEVLVIDSGSTDGTQDLATAAGARVLSHAWEGYGAQKNWAARQAKHDWILSLDADEAPDANLCEAIAAAAGSAPAVYGMLRITDFCGTWVRHGAWSNDVVWRLYHRNQAQWDERPVHETLVSQAARVQLNGELLHYSYPTLASHDAKMEPYLALSVASLVAANQQATFAKLHIAPGWRAFKAYILKGGWRDGWAGREIARRDFYMVREKYRRLKAIRNKKSAS